jgi:biotin transport system substrate-specific component
MIGVIILAAASQLELPWQPIPLTFQSTTVILIGMVLGARLGAQVIMSYLLLGMLGAPVFAQFSAGIPVLLGPNGGYLIGFIPAVIIAGFLAQRGWAQYWWSSFAAGLVGTSILFLLGVSRLYFILGWHDALIVGLTPFLISEPVKLLVASFLAPRFWRHSVD